jgi:hypothetical protein
MCRSWRRFPPYARGGSPWEDPDDQTIVTEEVSDDQIEDNMVDEDAPFPG